MFTKLRSPFKFVATSRPLDLFHLNRFDSYYKFTREKMIDIILCRERSEISLTVLLVNCHDITSRIFDRWISRQTGMKSSLKWHNQRGKKIRTFRKSTKMKVERTWRAGKTSSLLKVTQHFAPSNNLLISLGSSFHLQLSPQLLCPKGLIRVYLKFIDIHKSCKLN